MFLNQITENKLGYMAENILKSKSFSFKTFLLLCSFIVVVGTDSLMSPEMIYFFFLKNRLKKTLLLAAFMFLSNPPAPCLMLIKV